MSGTAGAGRGLAWAGLWRVGLLAAALVPLLTRGAGPVEIYRTTFEPEEGYFYGAALEGTNGWQASGEQTYQGENGITAGFFMGSGQQAFLGGSTNATGAEYYWLWRPVKWTPSRGETQQVHFSVDMSIASSTDQRYDNFYWDVYTIDNTRLFRLDFDNWDLGVYSLLQHETNRVPTGVVFTNDVIYRLQIWMDFAQNTWRAMLDDSVLESNQPMTTLNTPLNLGDIGLAWHVYAPGFPGENMIVFDNYDIVLGVEDGPVITNFGRARGLFQGQVTRCVPGRTYLVEFSRDLVQWLRVSTNTANPSGVFDFVDRNIGPGGQRFYRVRLPPRPGG